MPWMPNLLAGACLTAPASAMPGVRSLRRLGLRYHAQAVYGVGHRGALDLIPTLIDWDSQGSFGG